MVHIFLYTRIYIYIYIYATVLPIIDCYMTESTSLAIEPVSPQRQEIDGWFELRFPNNLQGINTDRYYEHMHMREEESPGCLRVEGPVGV